MTEQDSAVGRSEVARDVTTAAALGRLAALLDHETPPWRTLEVPPLGHWLNFLPDARQSLLDRDGHPQRGGFLPADAALPRRMWAGSRIRFRQPLTIGQEVERSSVLTRVNRKSGRSGDLMFVTVRHEIAQNGFQAIVEEQDIVYRAAATSVAVAPPSSVVPDIVPTPDYFRMVEPDATMLFRFSALTFNAHRIHYDRAYARDVEDYAGLVVQGPLTAMLLMDLFLRQRPGAYVSAFTFTGKAPLLDGGAITLSGKDRVGGADLWASNGDGQVCMTATVEL